jgi:hypothetical protein
MPAGFGAIDHDHPPSRGDELLDDLDPHRAQAHDHHVPAHRADPPLPERSLDAPADQQLGDHREHDRREDRAARHEPDGVDAQPGLLAREAEVAVADGRDGLDGEVHGVDERHVRPVRLDVGRLQHQHRDDQQHAEQDDHQAQRPVGLGHQ